MLSVKGGSTRLQFSPFLQQRSAKAVKTPRLSDYMAHLTLSPYFSGHRATPNSLHSTSIVRTIIYQRGKFVQCYEASSFCFQGCLLQHFIKYKGD